MANTPGKFHFKVKSYDNEEGEYSAWQEAEPGTIIQFIMAHWFNEMLPNNLDIIVIKNQKGDQLAIDHENKDVFRFFLIPTGNEWSYYYKMTDIRFMFFTLEHFFSGLLETLQENMNKTMDDFRWVKGDFLHKDFHFSITRLRFLGHFIMFGVFLAFNLTFLTISIVTAITLHMIVAWLPLLFVIVSCAIYLRDHIRNLKWYFDQRFLEVQLSKGDRELHVWYHGHKKSIAKADIVSIQQHKVLERGEDGLWLPLYTRLEFQNGDILNLHRILIPQDLVKDKFHQERQVFQALESNKRSIEKPTSLRGYFPDATKSRYNR
jgi:uncharacterized membrane protein (DUF485 family)